VLAVMDVTEQDCGYQGRVPIPATAFVFELRANGVGTSI